MTVKREPNQSRVDVCYEVLFGREGHPEQSLVVAVDKMAGQMKSMLRYVWTISLLASSLIFKELWVLITHAQ
jgi:hypothetical protein